MKDKTLYHGKHISFIWCWDSYWFIKIKKQIISLGKLVIIWGKNNEPWSY